MYKKRNTIKIHLILIACIIAVSILERLNADISESKISDDSLNIILITISTLRADHVSCFGYERDTTPNFDKFSEDNILFKNAFATSGWMMPAHGSIFTSLYPSVHGATHIDNNLKEEPNTLAEMLSDNGYYCVGFSCGPRLDNKHGFAQGFDLYDDYSVPLMLESLTFGNAIISDINKQRTNALINDAAIGWLRKNTHKPFFMFLHYYDNHWDYLPPPPYDKIYDPDYEGPFDGQEISKEPLYSNPPDERDIQHIIALYDGEIKQTDSDLGEMLKFLKDKGLFDNSIIIILGDHGEQFYEHGSTSHQGLYEELIHIPLAVSVPNASAKGKTIDSLVSQIDIMPTILDYLQIPVPQQCLGESLRPLIEGRQESIHEYIFVEYTGGAIPDIFAVRSAQFKCFMDKEGNYFAYDLIKDPGEHYKILPSDFPGEIKILQEHLIKIMSK